MILYIANMLVTSSLLKNDLSKTYWPVKKNKCPDFSAKVTYQNEWPYLRI